MPNITEEMVLNALRTVIDPDLHRDIVSLGFVKQVQIHDGQVAARIELTTPACPVKERLRQQAHDSILALPGVVGVAIEMTAQVKSAAKTKDHPAPGVKHIIAVASGKGGVGKSTTAVNLALALLDSGAKVGIMDADIYGPSLPRLLNIESRLQTQEEAALRKFPAREAYGLKAISIGFFMPEDSPMVWRGPMVAMAVEQLLRDVEWGELDYLIVDMPPGTGDAQLTLTQKVPLAGAVIVSTPQDVALADVKKGIGMFNKVNVPILGIIENMSYYLCTECGHRAEIFSHGGARREAERANIPFLGEIPLEEATRIDSDAGHPVMVARPDSPQAEIYRTIAAAIAARVATLHHQLSNLPNIIVED